MSEIVALRTYTRRVEDLGGGVRRTQCHVGHIHFRDDATGAFEPIDHTWVDEGTHWSMTRASYRMRVAKDFAAPSLIHYQNRFEGAAHDLTYEPHSLVWATGRDLADVRPFRAQQAVQGVVVGHTIRYSNAFGPGLHFEVTLRGSGFTKELVIRRRADLEAPPTAAHRLVLLSRYTPTGGVSLKDASGRTWKGDGEFDDPNDDGFSLAEPNGRHSIVRPAYIVESDANETRHRCPVIWTQRNGSTWQAKVLPTAVLTSGVYPLRADTVTSFFAGAGDGWVYNTNASWATMHAAATGSSADPTGTTLRVGTGNTPNPDCRRAFFPVDTSGIPDGDTITAATFYAKVQALTSNGDNDGDDWFVLVGPTSQASPTTLGTADFDTCGAVTSPQEITSDRKDYSSLPAVGSYASWALNSTGLSIVSKTSYTLIGMREGHDVLNSAYSGASTTNQVRFYTSEQAGTTDDPYLEVTHAAAAAGAGPALGGDGRAFGRGRLLGGAVLRHHAARAPELV